MRPMLLAFFLFVPTLAAGDEPNSRDRATEYEAFIKEYEAAEETWRKANPPVGPEDPSWIKRYESSPAWTFAPRLIRFAETNHGFLGKTEQIMQA
jgi:hypothetical protein